MNPLSKSNPTSIGISSLIDRVTFLANGADLVKLRRYLSEKVETTDCWRTIVTPWSSSSSSPFFTEPGRKKEGGKERNESAPELRE